MLRKKEEKNRLHEQKTINFLEEKFGEFKKKIKIWGKKWRKNTKNWKESKKLGKCQVEIKKNKNDIWRKIKKFETIKLKKNKGHKKVKKGKMIK